jgi:hypothetical protein
VLVLRRGLTDQLDEVVPAAVQHCDRQLLLAPGDVVVDDAAGREPAWAGELMEGYWA